MRKRGAMRQIFRHLAGGVVLLLILVGMGTVAAPRLSAEPPTYESLNLQKIYRHDDPLVKQLHDLFVLQGTAPPFASAPYSGAEILQNLDRLGRARMSPYEQALAEAIRSELVPRGLLSEGASDSNPGLVVNAGVELNLEAYLQSDPHNRRWEYEHARRRPLLSIPFEAWVTNSAYATFDVTLRQNYPNFEQYIVSRNDYDITAAHPENLEASQHSPYLNISPDISEFSPALSDRAYLAIGGDQWSAQFGRDQIVWAPAHSGSLLKSDASDYDDFLRFTTFWDRLKFSYFWQNMDRAEAYSSDPMDSPLAKDNSTGPAPRMRQRNLLGHRLEFRVGDRLNIGMSESQIVATESVELRYLMPMMVFHHWFIPHPDSALTASWDFSYAVAPGWSLYGQYAVNSIALPIHGDFIEDEPNAWAALLGLSGRRPLGTAGYLAGSLEGVYVNPWYGIHRQRYTSFSWSNRVKVEHISGRPDVRVEKPLGYPYGPDFAGIFIDLDYIAPGRFSLGTAVSLRAKGKNDLYFNVVDDYESGSPVGWAPTGAYPEQRIVWELRGSRLWSTSPQEFAVPRYEIGTSLYTILTRNERFPGNEQTASDPRLNLQWTMYTTVRF